ncbi:MAG: nucleotidyltransferase family protein [Bryobacteraceae bacterium]|nr:nucleotidyltransferase family protein [Bryobacteraceae bacterium]
MKPAAILLAGGASTRMGQPKALLPIAGETFLGRLIGLYAKHCAPVIVVLGYQADTIRAAIPMTADFVRNPQPELGQFSSLQTGLRALPRGADCLFQPIDYPAVSEKTVELLASTSGELVIPRYAGERGHPVRLSPAIVAELLGLPPDAQARDVIRAHYPEATFVEVDDPGITKDIDTPEDFARWIA